MNIIAKTALRSVWYRRNAAIMAVFSVAISVFVLLSVEHIRSNVKQHFSRSTTGVDLIVGPRTGDMNLLLYSVFNVGYPTHTLSGKSYVALSKHPNVDWVAPIVLGDTHKGYRVVGTTSTLFSQLTIGDQQPLTFAAGEPFSVKEVVLGAKVAAKLGYQLSSKIVLSHGLGKHSFKKHKEAPLRVSGILAPTGTPIDHAIYTSVTTLVSIHDGHGHHSPGADKIAATKQQAQTNSEHTEHDHSEQAEHDHGEHAEHDHGEHAEHDHGEHAEHDHGEHAEHDHSEHAEHDHSEHTEHGHSEHPEALINEKLSAVFVGVNDRRLLLTMQRQINQYSGEALTAILPGVVMMELWQIMNNVEQSLQFIALLVFIATIFGIAAMLQSSMRERRQEIDILRTIGASPSLNYWLLTIEAFVIVSAGILAAGIIMTLSVAIINYAFDGLSGIPLSFEIINQYSLMAVLSLIGLTFIISSVPAYSAYAMSKKV